MIKCPNCGKSTFKEYARLIYPRSYELEFFIDEYKCNNCANIYKYLITFDEAEHFQCGILVEENKKFTNLER